MYRFRPCALADTGISDRNLLVLRLHLAVPQLIGAGPPPQSVASSRASVGGFGALFGRLGWVLATKNPEKFRKKPKKKK